VKLQRAVKYFILRALFWRAYAARMDIPYSYVHCYLSAKAGADLARLVSNPELLIDLMKKALLEAM
jgi:hypothetical protein